MRRFYKLPLIWPKIFGMFGLRSIALRPPATLHNRIMIEKILFGETYEKTAMHCFIQSDVFNSLLC